MEDTWSVYHTQISVSTADTSNSVVPLPITVVSTGLVSAFPGILTIADPLGINVLVARVPTSPVLTHRTMSTIVVQQVTWLVTSQLFRSLLIANTMNSVVPLQSMVARKESVLVFPGILAIVARWEMFAPADVVPTLPAWIPRMMLTIVALLVMRFVDQSNHERGSLTETVWLFR